MSQGFESNQSQIVSTSNVQGWHGNQQLELIRLAHDKLMKQEKDLRQMIHFQFQEFSGLIGQSFEQVFNLGRDLRGFQAAFDDKLARLGMTVSKSGVESAMEEIRQLKREIAEIKAATLSHSNAHHLSATFKEAFDVLKESEQKNSRTQELSLNTRINQLQEAVTVTVERLESEQNTQISQLKVETDSRLDKIEHQLKSMTRLLQDELHKIASVQKDHETIQEGMLNAIQLLQQRDKDMEQRLLKKLMYQ